MEKKEYTLELAGKTVTAQFSDLADQANGSVMLSADDTVVFATAVMSKDGSRNPGYFNLTVEYQEKYYASGEILGGQYNKREGRPSDEAVLSGRMIDRTLRPLFDHRIQNAIQIVVTVLSVGNMDPGVLAINAASLALATSNIPWNGPVGAVHVGRHNAGGANSDILVNHYIKEGAETEETGSYTLDLTVCGQGETFNMIEAGAAEASETDVVAAFEAASAATQKLEKWQKEIVSEIGQEKKVVEFPELPAELVTDFDAEIAPRKDELFGDDSKTRLYELETAWLDFVKEKLNDDEAFSEVRGLAIEHFHHFVDKAYHEAALKDGKRADGRALDQVRGLYAQAGGISPVLHGTGIFYRGETHILSALTLGGPDDAQVIEGMEVKLDRRFMHHYNFPPFSVGDTGRVGGFNRRAIGHGTLGQKALEAVLPPKTEFPYTIRIVSEAMASNGSTSQGSICAASLALMDAGVPVKSHVAGISVGVMVDEKDPSNYVLLTDIQGPEDHHGDMDFKVAGTKEGITAIQMDIKVSGLPLKVLTEALDQAKTARLHILETMEAAIAEPRADISPRAPKITVTIIPVEKIGMVIGSGGKTIKEIKERTGAEITIEDDGTVYCVGTNGAADKALEIIKAMTKDWTVGEKAEGEVVKIIDGVGAIVKFGPFNEGMAHISELAPFRVQQVQDVLKEGMTIPVTIIKVDKERDRIGLSIKQDNPNFLKNPYDQK